MSICMQVCASLIVCLLTINLSNILSWPSSSLTLLRSNETVLTRPLTDREAGLLGSISSLFGLISCPLIGVLQDRIGRKYCALLCASSSVICWALVAFTNKVEIVIAGMFISGMNASTYLLGAVFIIEFCQDSIRGALTSGPGNFSVVGSLLSFILGGVFDYYMMAYVSLGISIISMLLLCWLEESPVYLMKIGREKAAIKSLVFYRRKKANSNEIRQELEKIRRSLTVGLDERSGVTRRAFYISLVLITVLVFQGVVVVQVYAGPLFAEVVPEISPTLFSVLFGVIATISGFVTAYLSDFIGRRPLLIYASLAAGICCILCGTQIQWAWGPNWLGPVFIYLFTAFYMLGVGTVALVYIAEIILPEVRSHINTICNEWMLICNFLILIIFDPLTNIIGLGCVFHLFAAICIFTSIFSYIFIPETKGLSVAEIQKLL